ncbi:hypothetical protein ACTXT7_013296 [Hymenolepis weldensis]
MDEDAPTVGDNVLTVNEVAAGCHSRRKQEKPCRVEIAANERAIVDMKNQLAYYHYKYLKSISPHWKRKQSMKKKYDFKITNKYTMAENQ